MTHHQAPVCPACKLDVRPLYGEPMHRHKVCPRCGFWPWGNPAAYRRDSPKLFRRGRWIGPYWFVFRPRTIA